MINDWVQNTSHIKGRVIGFRYYQPDEENEIVIDYGNSTSWSSPNLIEPIPLTGRILEKNGFEKKYNGYGNDYIIYLSYPEREFRLYECFDGYGSNIVGYGIKISGNTVEINYLHELQHALRLCGLTDLANDVKV